MTLVHLITVKAEVDFPIEDYLAGFDLAVQTKIKSYHFRHDQVLAFTSAYLKKYYLAKYLGLPPASLAFAESEWGRPYISNWSEITAQAAKAYPLVVDFNLTHSGQLVALAIYSGDLALQIGVDIEIVDEKINLDGLAQVVYSASEQALLANSAENFFKLWTKKEALIKARGCGFGDEFYHTTSLNLAAVEKSGNYQIVCRKYADYYLSCCVYIRED